VEDEILRLAHLGMACFARYAQAAIDVGDHERLNACYEFADCFFRAADGELENAFYVSYLENLSFDRPGGETAKSLMSPSVARRLE
jgi:hypothetical protein